MSVVEASPHLRDFLRIKDDDAAAAPLPLPFSSARHPELAGLMLASPSPPPRRSGKQPYSPPHRNTCGAASDMPTSRTLLDIIRDDRQVEQGKDKDHISWKSLKERLWLRRPGPHSISVDQSPSSREASARLSSEHSVVSAHGVNSAPADGVVQDGGDSSLGSRRGSTRFGTLVPISIEPAAQSPYQLPRHQMVHQNSSSPSQSPPASVRPESPSISREGSISRDPLNAPQAGEPPRESMRRLSVVLAEERQQSAREAEAAQEAAAVTTDQTVRMSLMDLLEETDRHISLLVEDDDGGESIGPGRVEQKCCICMVRDKGAAFIPCGHTFCRLCSRELWVTRGNCPLCNNCIVEILDIF